MLKDNEVGSRSMPGAATHAPGESQRQRICCPRALALNPKVVIADESVSAQDPFGRRLSLTLCPCSEMGIAFCLFPMKWWSASAPRGGDVSRSHCRIGRAPRCVSENPQHPALRR